MISDLQVDPDTTNFQLRMEKRGLNDIQRPKSILNWHITLMFDQIYTIFYCLTMLVLHVFKGLDLRYPP